MNFELKSICIWDLPYGSIQTHSLTVSYWLPCGLLINLTFTDPFFFFATTILYYSGNTTFCIRSFPVPTYPMPIIAFTGDHYVYLMTSSTSLNSQLPQTIYNRCILLILHKPKVLYASHRCNLWGFSASFKIWYIRLSYRFTSCVNELMLSLQTWNLNQPQWQPDVTRSPS